jgi:hypothetical protein
MTRLAHRGDALIFRMGDSPMASDHDEVVAAIKQATRDVGNACAEKHRIRCS